MCNVMQTITPHIIKQLEQAYINGLEEETFSAESEKAGLALLCLSSLEPLIFNRIIITHFAWIRRQWDGHPQYSTRIWDRLLSLDCLLYCHTGDRSYLKVPIANINHHNRLLRWSVWENLYYIAPKLNFNDKEILERTWQNIKSWHGGLDLNLYLIHRMQGEWDSKVKQYKIWLDSIGNEYGGPQDIIEEFIRTKTPRNPFGEQLSEIKDYLIHALADCYLKNHQEETI